MKQLERNKQQTTDLAAKTPMLGTIRDLNKVLFDTLFKLQKGAIKESKAKSISAVSQTILNAAKIELAYRIKFGNQKAM